jgi:hypothetical protein
MPQRGSFKPPAEPVVKPYGCDCISYKDEAIYPITNQEMVYMAYICHFLFGWFLFDLFRNEKMVSATKI